MKTIFIGLWAVIVTVASGYAVFAFTSSGGNADEPPRLEGLRYTSLPTMSVPVVEAGRVTGYIVVRLVYTADGAVLRRLSAEPGPFLSDEMFRHLYGRAETAFGRLQRLDLTTLAEDVRTAVNTRMGDEVIQDLLIDGLNYVDLAQMRDVERQMIAPLEPGNGVGGQVRGEQSGRDAG